MENKKYISIPEAAKLLGLTRQSVYLKVKNNQIKAVKIGRNYAIPTHRLFGKLRSILKEEDKDRIKKIVKRVVSEYGEALRLLGSE